MHALKIRDVVKRFEATTVLKNVSIEIEPGEFLVLVGPSGCGKSTLLNCIAGLETPTSGEIWLGERRIDTVPPKDRDIAMVFQSYALYPNMDVRGNIAFGMEMRKVPRAAQEARIAEVARMLQIEHLLDRRPGQLSGGQRQRVAMGRALARQPSMFLFDEPLSNLDAKLRVEMRAEIKLLYQRTRTTSVYVTHDQVEAMTLGTRIVIMKDGAIQQFGTPKDLYQRPANLFVAGFIGSPSMNMLPVTLEAAGANVRLTLTGHPGTHVLELPASEALRGHAGRAVTLGIRPEAVTRAVPGQPGLDCTVDLVEPTGPDTFMLTRVNGTPLQARLAPQDDAAPGDPITLAFAADQTLLFDTQTGQRIAP